MSFYSEMMKILLRNIVVDYYFNFFFYLLTKLSLDFSAKDLKIGNKSETVSRQVIYQHQRAPREFVNKNDEILVITRGRYSTRTLNFKCMSNKGKLTLLSAWLRKVDQTCF